MSSIRSTLLVAAALVLVAAADPAPRPELHDAVVRADETITLRSAADGILAEVLVDRGDPVTAGQVVALLRFEVEEAASLLAQARADCQADLQRARVELDHARREFARKTILRERGVLEQDRLDEAEFELKKAEAEVAKEEEERRIARLEFEKAQRQWEQRRILSPIAGVVSDRLCSPGEMVTRSVDSPILEILRLDPLRVELHLPIALYAKVARGDRARVFIDGFDGSPFAATVTRVAARADPASGTFAVDLALPNPDRRLPAGLRCKVSLED